MLHARHCSPHSHCRLMVWASKLALQYSNTGRHPTRKGSGPGRQQGSTQGAPSQITAELRVVHVHGQGPATSPPQAG